MPPCRLVTWSLILAGKDLQTGHQPLAWGGLPGYLQTVIRGEITAFIAALTFGRKHGQTFAIWSDCAHVISRAKQIQEGWFVVNNRINDHDLWQVVEDLLPDASVCQLHHIRSHQNYVEADPWLQWACSANDMADVVATEAFAHLPPGVLQAQVHAFQAFCTAKEVIKHVHAHFLRVAHFAISQVEPRTVSDRQVDDATAVDWKQVALTAVEDAPRKLRFEGWSKILEWMQWVASPTTAPKWYSWFELLALFQIWSNERGVESTSAHGTWRSPTKLQEYDAKVACHSWSAYMTQLVRLVHPQWKPSNSRPANGRFQCWSMGALCSLTETCDRMLHQWFREQLGDQRITRITQLYQHGPASLNSSVEGGVPLQHGLHRYWPR